MKASGHPIVGSASGVVAVWISRDTESGIALVQMAGRALRYQPGKVARIYPRTPDARVRLAAAMLRLDLLTNRSFDDASGFVHECALGDGNPITVLI